MTLATIESLVVDFANGVTCNSAVVIFAMVVWNVQSTKEAAKIRPYT